ncbi:Guanine nucleotide binding protein (G protein), beta polypeptide 1-like [Thoreauomyces humboldtii]|nr:Guanine nucleotide binding protein (G protein), beta polypeptide 1-like [Thoreauomyces humboldtii]
MAAPVVRLAPRPPRPPPAPIYILRGHGLDVTSVTFGSDNTFLASGDVEGNIILWSLETRRPLCQWKAHSASILALHEVGAGKLLSHGRDDQLHVWTLSKEEPLNATLEFTLLVNSLNFCAVAILSDVDSMGQSRTLLALPGIDENAAIDIYDLTARKYERQGICVAEATKDTGLCMCLKFFQDSNGGQCLAAGYEAGAVIVWDFYSGKLLARSKFHDEPVLSLDMTPEGAIGFSGAADTKIVNFRFDLTSSGTGELTLLKAVAVARGISIVRIRPDARIVICGGWNSSISVYAIKSFKPLAVLSAHRLGIQCLAFPKQAVREAAEASAPTPGNLFAAGSKDGTITLWEIY